jgi:hypothetical protein
MFCDVFARVSRGNLLFFFARRFYWTLVWAVLQEYLGLTLEGNNSFRNWSHPEGPSRKNNNTTDRKSPTRPTHETISSLGFPNIYTSSRTSAIPLVPPLLSLSRRRRSRRRFLRRQLPAKRGRTTSHGGRQDQHGGHPPHPQVHDQPPPLPQAIRTNPGFIGHLLLCHIPLNSDHLLFAAFHLSGARGDPPRQGQRPQGEI